MVEAVAHVNTHIAERVRALRVTQGLSLEALAEKSGVSRSMISLIERGESSPTAVVLDKLAAALNVTLASLFQASATSSGTPTSPLVRRNEQPVWQDPASGYHRRNVSPPNTPSPIQVVEVRFPPGGYIAFETSHRALRIHQQVWILEGTMTITVGEERHKLFQGDCLAMQLSYPTMFHNPTKKLARYVVITVTEPPGRR